MKRLTFATSAAFFIMSVGAHTEELKLSCPTGQSMHITYDFLRSGSDILLATSMNIALPVVGMNCGTGPATFAIRGLPATFKSLDEVKTAIKFISDVADVKVTASKKN